jgi:hypothetical protein
VNSLTLRPFLLVMLGLIFGCLSNAQAQQSRVAGPTHKEQLETRKLELEVAGLEDARRVPWWFPVLVGFTSGVVGATVTVWGARRARIGALDQALHEKRIEVYAELVAATTQLALYFPSKPSVSSSDCHVMGEAMSAWYFKKGGLLMSPAARDAYFLLARALTRASLVPELRVPIFPVDAHQVSVTRVDRYRQELADRALSDVEGWEFGGAVPESGAPSLRFKDFVFLQRLSSSLRTELSKDLHSRRRPS